MQRANCRIEVRSFFFGIYLGSCNSIAIDRLEWSGTQRDWIEWKAAYLRTNLKYACVLSETQTSDGSILSFKINGKKGRGRIYSKWLRNQKGCKAITPRIRHFNHPMGLTALILDVGTVTADRVTLDLKQYTVAELELLQAAWRDNLDLNCVATQDSQIEFAGEDLVNLWSLVEPTVPRIPYAQETFKPLRDLLVEKELVPLE
jgi:hypothetical protein